MPRSAVPYGCSSEGGHGRPPELPRSSLVCASPSAHGLHPEHEQQNHAPHGQPPRSWRIWVT